MSTTRKQRVEGLDPTDGYKQAIYGLRCGDRGFAEDFVRRQLGRTRSVREAFEIAARIGLLSERGRELVGLTPTQLSLPIAVPERNGSEYEEDSRLDFVKDRLRRAGHSGLGIWTLVTEIGKHEQASFRDEEWRRPVAAELNEYADLNEIVRVDTEDKKGTTETRFYHLGYMPTSVVMERVDSPHS